MTIPVKPSSWVETALQIRAYHVQQLKNDEKHTAAKTAKQLNRSRSSICEYLKIASWYKTHPVQIGRCETIHEALALISKLDRERELQD